MLTITIWDLEPLQNEKKQQTDPEPADHRPEGEWFTEANEWVSV